MPAHSFATLPATMPWSISSDALPLISGAFAPFGNQPQILFSDIVDGAIALGMVVLLDKAELVPSAQGSVLFLASLNKGGIPASPVGTASWTLSTDDQFLALPAGPNKNDIVIVFNLRTQFFGCLEWSDVGWVTRWVTSVSALGCGSLAPDTSVQVTPNGLLWIFDPVASTLIIASGVQQQDCLTSLWTGQKLVDVVFNQNTQFLFVNLNSPQGIDFFAIIDQSRCLITVVMLTCDSLIFSREWQGGNELPMAIYDPTAQYYACDLNGDGYDEIVVWTSISKSLSVLIPVMGYSLAWTAPAGPRGNTVPGNGDGWIIQSTDQYWVQLADTTTGQAQLMVYQAADCSIGTLRWSANINGLENNWGAPSRSIPADTEGDSAWTVDWCEKYLPVSNSCYTFCLSSNQPAAGFLVTYPDGTPRASQVTLGPIQGWSPGFVSQFPDTPFPQWPEVQNDIYAYLSSYGLAGCLDIRSIYTNQNVVGNTSIYAENIKSAQNPGRNPNTPNQIWSDADFDAVQGRLVLELDSISPIWNLAHSMTDLAQALYDQQSSDFASVSLLMQNFVGANPGLFNYWPGQIVCAALWGLAAVPGLDAGAIPLAMTASMYGSLLSWSPNNTGSSSSATLEKYQEQIYSTFISAAASADNFATKVVQDFVLLPMVGSLAQTGWAWNTKVMDDIIKQSNANQILYYSLLLPAYAKIMTWSAAEANFPGYPIDIPRGGELYESISAPASSYIYSQNDDGYSYQIWMIYSGSDYINDYSDFLYPGDDLMYDLFTNLGITKTDVLTCQGIWSQIKMVPSGY